MARHLDVEPENKGFARIMRIVETGASFEAVQNVVEYVEKLAAENKADAPEWNSGVARTGLSLEEGYDKYDVCGRYYIIYFRIMGVVGQPWLLGGGGCCV